jgi:hypothetical protein
MQSGVVQSGRFFPSLISLYVNDMPTPFRQVELALYADDTVLVATFRKPSFLVSYLETNLDSLEYWLWDWRITKTSPVFEGR